MRNPTVIMASILVAILFNPGRGYAQRPSEMAPGYYVVVAAYAPTQENVAKNYTELLIRRGVSAAYGFNSNKNYYYVYLNYFTNLKASLTDMLTIRRQNNFGDAWVRVIPGVIEPGAERSAPAVTSNVAPVTSPVAALPPAQETTPVVTEPVVASPDPSPIVYASSKADGIIVTDNPPIRQFPKITLGNTEVFLSLFNSTNNRIVEGVVTVVDPEAERDLKQVSGNEYLNLPNPRNKSGKLILRCEAFGYRKIEHEINYNLPLADTTKDYIDLMGTTFVVNFDMVRYHKGDIATLFNVYFYNDAAIMLPESKTELTNLLQLLQENEHYRIMLHGHTNGNYHGKIITVGPDKNFFSLEGSKTTVGSAKDLSFDRAEIIKEYLEANGIASSRIEVKAWGGKRPIYDRHSANAKKNVRVEVEILEE